MTQYTNKPVTLDVLAWRTWSAEQWLACISEEEFLAHKIAEHRRYTKWPDCWIFIEWSGTEVPPPGRTLFAESFRNAKARYWLQPFPKPEPSPPVVTQGCCLGAGAHLFRASPELRLLYCERCGEMRYPAAPLGEAERVDQKK